MTEPETPSWKAAKADLLGVLYDLKVKLKMRDIELMRLVAWWLHQAHEDSAGCSVLPNLVYDDLKIDVVTKAAPYLIGGLPARDYATTTVTHLPTGLQASSAGGGIVARADCINELRIKVAQHVLTEEFRG